MSCQHGGFLTQIHTAIVCGMLNCAISIFSPSVTKIPNITFEICVGIENVKVIFGYERNLYLQKERIFNCTLLKILLLNFVCTLFVIVLIGVTS